MVLDQGPFARLATTFAASGTDLPSELAALDQALSDLEEGRPEMEWFEEARLAADIRELYARLSALPARDGQAPPTSGMQARVVRLRSRLADLRSTLMARSIPRHDTDRARIRGGGLRGAELYAWLSAYPPAQRDLAIEHLLGIGHPPLETPSLGSELIDYLSSGIAPIVRAVLDVPVTPDDVFVDLGAGLGKVVMAVNLLSGARARGIELQPELCMQARGAAAELALQKVSFVSGDARESDLSDATVIFLYLPFTGGALATVMERLRAVAQRRDLVLCALGLDLRGVDWITARETGEFWLSIYDSRIPGAEPRPLRPSLLFASPGEDIARER